MDTQANARPWLLDGSWMISGWLEYYRKTGGHILSPKNLWEMDGIRIQHWGNLWEIKTWFPVKTSICEDFPLPRLITGRYIYIYYLLGLLGLSQCTNWMWWWSIPNLIKVCERSPTYLVCGLRLVSLPLSLSISIPGLCILRSKEKTKWWGCVNHAKGSGHHHSSCPQSGAPSVLFVHV